MTIYDEIRAALAEATPGPWEANNNGPLWWVDSPNGTLANIDQWSSEQDEADARLIALTPTTAKMALRLEAADQIAEALVAALEAFEEIEDYETGRRALLPSLKYRKQFASEALAAYRQKESE